MKTFIFIMLIVLGTFTIQTNQLTGQEVISFLEGTLEGMASEVSGLDQCIGDVYQAGEDIVSAVESFEQKSEGSVKSGLKQLGSVLELLPSAMKECKASVEAVENVVKMIKSFTSPWSFVFHVGKDIIVNGRNILNEIETCVTDYHNADYNGMGQEVGQALYQIFLGESMTQNIQLTVQEKNILQFFEGVGEGILIQVPDLANCLGDVYSAGQTIYTAVQDFEQEDEAGIKSGLDQIGTILNQLPNSLTQCKASVESIASIKSILETYNSFWSFTYHVGKEITVNGKNIYDEVKQACTDYHNDDYLAMGYQVGTAVYQIFVGSTQQQQLMNFQMTTTETETVSFFEGVLQGLAIDIDGTTECISGVQSIGSEIDAAFTSFEQKDYEGVESGLRQIGQIIQQFPNDMKTCQVSEQQMLQIVKMCKSFTSFWSFAYHVGEDIEVNGTNIFTEIDNAITDYHNSDYESAGNQIGSALYKIFINNTVQLRRAQA